MIKFHYFDWPANDMRAKGLRVPRKQGLIRCCHVYSDCSGALARKELLFFGKGCGWPAAWASCEKFPHFDAWGRMLRFCGDPISDREFVTDMHKWKSKELR